jgi:hypothetical protein
MQFGNEYGIVASGARPGGNNGGASLDERIVANAI